MDHAPHQNDLELAIAAPGRTLVVFSAPWCGACRMLKPVVAAVASEPTVLAQVISIAVDQEPDLADRYQVQLLPTQLLFREGREVARRVGFAAREVLSAWCQQG